MAGSHSLGFSSIGYPYVWGEKILIPARSSWNVITGTKSHHRYGPVTDPGYTFKREFYLTQADISWGNGYWGPYAQPGAIRWTGEMFISGKRLYYYSVYGNSDKLPDTYREERSWRCLGVLDLDTESSAIIDDIFGTPEPIGGYGANVNIEPVVVTRDGYLHGVLEGRRSPSILSYRFIEWGPDGHRTFEGPIVHGITNASSPDFLAAPRFNPRLHSRDLVVASIVVGASPRLRPVSCRTAAPLVPSLRRLLNRLRRGVDAGRGPVGPGVQPGRVAFPRLQDGGCAGPLGREHAGHGLRRHHLRHRRRREPAALDRVIWR